MKETNTMSRRTFLRKGAAGAALPLMLPAAARGASEKITLGCIGVGPQGAGVMRNFLRHRTARVVAVCDVQRPRREAARDLVNKHYGDTGCAMYTDFRELLAREDIDAVSIASPDHWHVLHAIHAARAGKDMYVEKPLGLSLAELQALRHEIHANGCRFQFGTQQRSSRNFQQACELVRNGYIGELKTMKVGAPASIPGGELTPAPVPDWLDYDLWLGPAREAPFAENRIINNYWWHMSDYALGFVAGWGIHHVDIAQWGNGADGSGPVEIEGTGEFPEEGVRDCATGWDIRCRYANGVDMHFTDNNRNPQGVIFEGTEGRVYVRRGVLETEPASLLRVNPKPGEIHLDESRDHTGNLLDCIRSRRPAVCNIDTAVASDIICHLSNIAMRTGRKLRWDPDKECFIDDRDAARFLKRAMRAPWRL
jgi:predicted dehydrogenase